eukprot:GHRQ01030529.1.p5 GENE.GHRQ01030529.1~~GHRQ01030529.1.p5  ORF type:complete len:106 (-),score=38.98 GHRQ01030529.1:370-687(-)
MHIHGVYWGSMDGISQRMGWNVLAMDATASWDGIAGSDKVYNSAIVVYPQSTPSPYTNPDQRMVSWHTLPAATSVRVLLPASMQCIQLLAVTKLHMHKCLYTSRH